MWSYRHPGFEVHQLAALSDNYIYLIAPGNESSLLVVDPAEEEPVIRASEHLGRKPTHILNTHHHWDHTGANLALKRRYGCLVIGSAVEASRIPGIDIPVDASHPPSLPGLQAEIIEVPGHTLGHIAYRFADALFCGDTLFGGGCGRLFEGSPAQMWQSLSKLARLPAETSIYCAHEYTLANLRFARTVNPSDETRKQALEQRIHEDTRKRMQHIPTIPSRMSAELATNPFLWPLDAGFVARYAHCHGIEDSAEVVFAHLRSLKDRA